ncbi:MAG: four helix bundle protein [Bacteroidetes bacterium]|jgi:four helix bundle protein|nr:four helix bundle protein [Bacteroidota bacterium]
MAKVQRFEDLLVWQKARQLTRRVYAISRDGRFAKDFGLKDQIRRAAVSVMSNIAEGFERNGNREFHQFLSTAKASAGEVRSQLYVALDEAYIDASTFDDVAHLTEELSKMLRSLMHHLRTSEFHGTKFRS